jgi:hypothetical protein
MARLRNACVSGELPRETARPLGLLSLEEPVNRASAALTGKIVKRYPSMSGG